MIDRAMLFVRDRLNEHIARCSGSVDAGLGEAIVFPDGDKLDPLTLKVGAVNMLLVNMEQEMVMRADDPFARTLNDGSTLAVQPALRLNLMILFVARYRAYDAGLAALFAVLHFFQSNRVFEARAFPDLDPRIGRLVVELSTLPVTQQNDLWASLRLAYHPSLLFRMRMLTIEQDADAAPAPAVSEPQRDVGHAVPALA
ncbi:Pvc16 family protein [Sphingomonas sp. HF-S4]|uniref:Pvc16 family protein n=1 Tax=Sphingomonas agrestis TaxID=3080540 RepID=A0ABU3Y1Y7_9SPHN|nr:Pvc16 family protein [Sphingomonas sp. HF-S4]MDV3455395.1 Pvc16 family protein [Sphingomonas sp. HF-S4]